MADWKLRITDIGDFEFKTENKDVSCLGGASTLISLNIEKEMYVPGHIEAVIEIKPNGNEFGTINYDSLLNKTASLEDKDKKEVAKDYIIFDCSLEDVPSGSMTSHYLTLGIYSPDHCLTFKKEKKCYVAKKLGANIFADIAKDKKDKIKRYDYSSLLRINEPKTDGTKAEFIQPYLVQYEETALDFLNRVANECGEFLYYEYGKWILGGVTFNYRTLGNYISLTYKKITSSEEEGDEVVVGTKEEYLETLKKHDAENFFKDWLNRNNMADCTSWLYNISNWAKKPNLAEMIATLTFDTGLAILKSAVKKDDQINLWNQTYFTPLENNPEQCGMVNGEQVVCQFSNYNAHERYGQEFYQEVRTGEKKANKIKIHINFGTNYNTMLLGDGIYYNNTPYYICKISYTCRYKDSKEEYTSYEIDAIPLIGGVKYPPLLERKAANKVENQVVTITANNDPLNLGRVQIRYPWQNKNDNPSSPWVSIAQPFASDKAGIRFMPQVDDNIIVGYEHGRMDRPFMVGGVSTSTRNLDLGINKIATLENIVTNTFIDDSANGYFKNDFVIKSPNGQYIKFLSPSNQSIMNFATSFAPCISNYLGYMPLAWDKLTYATDFGKEVCGGISIGDALGFFNINMSTEKRKVLISSAVGDVQIDAFTGITISAPNGNVKIEGKNVEIVAGNNLTLKSGTNVDKMKDAYGFKSAYGNVLKAQAQKMTKIVDVTLLRTLLETLFKPVGGTMLIKSKTYLCLEAGTGATSLPADAYKTERAQKVVNSKLKDMTVWDTIKATKNVIDAYQQVLRGHYGMFKNSFIQYHLAIRDFKIALTSFFDSGGTIKWNGQVVQNLGSFNDQIDSVEDIVKDSRKGKEEDAVHPKLNKFEFDKGNATSDKLDAVKSKRQKAQYRAACITKKINNYFGDIKKIKENKDGKIQTDYIEIADTGIHPLLNVKQYKNTIFHYMSKEGNAAINAAMNASENQFDGMNAQPTGLLLSIWTSLPKEITELQDFGIIGENFTISRNIRRKIFYKALNTLKDAKLLSINYEDFERTIGRKMPNEDSIYGDDETWQKYLEYVTLYKEEEGIGTKILNYLDYFGVKDFVDLKANWDDEASLHDIDHQGQILLADSKGNTCCIEKDGIKITKTSYVQNAIRDFIKDC